MPWTSPARRTEAIAALAASQHGVVTRKQLLDTGLGAGAIDWRIRRHLLHPLHAGVYLLGHAARAPLAQEAAAVLACGPGAVISHRSAARLWRLIDTAGRGQVEVTTARLWRPNPLKLRVYGTRSLLPRDISRFRGIPIASPARTLLDLGRFLSVDRLELAVADALRRGLARHADLVDQLERNRGRRGVARLRVVLAADSELALTRSEAETRMLALLRHAGLPRPEVNARLGAYEVDLLWRRAKLVVEVDGFAFHGDRQSFELDRIRDAELQAMGFRVIRVTWRQLKHERASVCARIARTLDFANG